MSMFRAMDISGSGLTAQRLRLDVIAENIANAETTRTPEGGPYQRLRVLMAAADEAEGGVRVAGIVPQLGPPKMVHDPSHPDADAEGYVQMPNVELATEMVDLVAASRAYEANSRALRVAREMSRDAVDMMS